MFDYSTIRELKGVDVMGFLARLLGILSSEKEALIRGLVRARFAEGVRLGLRSDSPDEAYSMGTIALLGTPEATIVTCVETWAKMQGEGLSDDAIAARLASMRRVSVAPGLGLGGASPIETTINCILLKEVGFDVVIGLGTHFAACRVAAKDFYGLR